MNDPNINFILGLWGTVVSTVLGIFQIYKYLTEKGHLKITLENYRRTTFDIDTIRATNKGRRNLTLVEFVVKAKNGEIIYKINDMCKTIEPFDYFSFQLNKMDFAKVVSQNIEISEIYFLASNDKKYKLHNTDKQTLIKRLNDIHKKKTLERLPRAHKLTLSPRNDTSCV